MSENYKACPFAKELRVQGIGEPDKTVGWLCSAVCNKCPARNPLRHGYNSVFNHITQSPEVLAEKLIFEKFKYTAFGDSYTCWLSPLFPEKEFETYEEAFAATVAKLKEACNGC